MYTDIYKAISQRKMTKNTGKKQEDTPPPFIYIFKLPFSFSLKQDITNIDAFALITADRTWPSLLSFKSSLNIFLMVCFDDFHFER